MSVKNYTFFLTTMLSLFTGTGFLSSEKVLPVKKEGPSEMFADNWTGIISYSYTIIDKRSTDADAEIKTEFELIRNTRIIITATGNRKGHATINHTMKRREKTDAPFGTQRYIQITESKETSVGEGDVEVDIEPSYDNKKYLLKTSGPLYEIETTSSFWTNTMGYSLGPPQTSTSTADGIPIDALDQSFGKNPNKISGSYIIFSSATHHVSVSWNLVKANKTGGIKSNPVNSTTGNTSTNNNPQGNQTSGSTQTTSNQNSSGNSKLGAELIITPEHYEDWKPAAGTGATTPGNKEKIGLLIQQNGTLLRAISFEVKLFSTSRKGSMAADNSDPHDIRFLPQPKADLTDDGQLIKIPCVDGVTGEVTIGSFHDKASTILAAEAILDNGTRIRGVLFLQGLTEIPIPKQDLTVIDKEKK
jgi:hypothetical protein